MGFGAIKIPVLKVKNPPALWKKHWHLSFLQRSIIISPIVTVHVYSYIFAPKNSSLIRPKLTKMYFFYPRWCSHFFNAFFDGKIYIQIPFFVILLTYPKNSRFRRRLLTTTSTNKTMNTPALCALSRQSKKSEKNI